MLEHAGQIKGLALVFREFPISRAVIELITAPELAGSADEVELVQRALALVETEGLGVAHICVLPESGRGKVLEQAGFTLVRTYLDMVWNEDELPELELPQGYSVRSFQAGDTPLLTRVQNDAFLGSWGFCPNSEEQIEYRTNMPNTSKAGLLFLFDGDHPAGYCWTVMVPAENGVRGMIGMIGVVPEYRGKGVSRHILQAGMKHLRSIGQAEIGLEVDGDNGPAVGLYRSIGFKTMGERHWFERVLPGT
ncbi:MAG: GNAT family N-acetyltransferase [Chloroflexi bacterium]|nr:GNAT family N-acetyltransferase [Chloroflexota bacterium]